MSSEMGDVQKIFANLNPKAKLDIMFKAGTIGPKEYYELSCKLKFNPDNDALTRLTNFENRFFDDPQLWNDEATRSIVRQDSIEALNGGDLFQQLSQPEFDSFIATAKVKKGVSTAPEIVSEIESEIKSTRKEVDENFWVDNPGEAERAGRTLLRDLTFENLDQTNLESISTNHDLVIQSKSPISVLGRLRRDVQGHDKLNFPLQEGGCKVMQVPPHLNVEIFHGKMKLGDGETIDAKVNAHIFYPPIKAPSQ